LPNEAFEQLRSARDRQLWEAALLQRPHTTVNTTALITVDEFAELARLSRRQIDRLRRRRLPGFPREYELGSGGSKYRRCPRFKFVEVQRWLDSRALW
jgi:predicted DNA-binding transcriptional regulator AlpA